MSTWDASIEFNKGIRVQRMKDSHPAKEYSNILLDIINKVRLLGTKFKDSRFVGIF